MTRDQICEYLGFNKSVINYTQSYPDKKQPKSRYCKELVRYNRRTTVYDNLVKLQKQKIIEKTSSNNGKRGRPPTFWRIKQYNNIELL